MRKAWREGVMKDGRRRIGWGERTTKQEVEFPIANPNK
jgi:hypothetical protein